MSTLAFHNKGKYADFSEGYSLYCKRCKKTPMDYRTYCRIVREYCASLSERFEKDGMIDFPNDNGTLFVSFIRRKPQYRGKKFIGFGKINWKDSSYDGSNTAFGIVYLPKRYWSENMRCLGFVSNRRLFRRLKEIYELQKCNWIPMDFNESMI